MEDLCLYLLVGNKDVVYRLKRSDKTRDSQRKHWLSKNIIHRTVLHWKKTGVYIYVYLCMYIHQLQLCVSTGR